jgi:hypothetical protein
MLLEIQYIVCLTFTKSAFRPHTDYLCVSTFFTFACVKVGLHVRVNFRESYREHLAMACRRESKSWLAGSLRSLLRAPELRDLSEYEVSVYT